MFRATCSLLLLLAGQVFADGWSSDIWPSQEHPMEGWRQLHECYTATVERCSVVSKTAPILPVSRLSVRQSFTNIKERLSSCVTSYVNKAKMDATSPVGQSYYEGFVDTVATNVPSPYETVTGVLWRLQMPTNYFAFTPYLGLSGLGGFTNDASTDYPHGYTNSFTVAGGTNYPGTRTVWYDTDYGFVGFTNICAQLLFTEQNSYTSVTYMGSHLWYGTSPLKVFWTNAQATAESLYSDKGALPIVFIGTVGEKRGGGFFASLLSGKGYPAVYGVWTGCSHTVEFYLHNGTYGNYAGDVISTFGEFSAANQFFYLSTVGETTDGVVTSSVSYGLWEDGTKPTPWCAEPSPVVTITSLGWRPTLRCLIRWDVSGGFQFK